VELPAPINYDEIEADYRDGFLTVVLPKLQPQKVELE
jgi:HSP20 family molecular chaperone IbpA